MKKILLMALLLLSLIVCITSLGWASGFEDANAGIEAVKVGEYDKAIRLFTNAIGSGELSQENLSIVYYNRGNAWRRKGEYDKAIADYTRAIEINPKKASAYNNRGNAWRKKGEYDKAIADYTKVIEIDPQDVDAYYNRGYAWGKKGDYDKAIADFTKAIEIDPQHADAYLYRGYAWEDKGDYDKAIADYTKVIEIDPWDADTYYDRGYAWEDKGDYDKAIADYTKAIEIYPEYTSAYNSLAWLMATCPDGRYRDGPRAVELAEKAVNLEETAQRLDTLAAAYAEAGRFQDAIKTQEKAITKLKQEARTKDLPQYEKHRASYKAGDPWREN